MRIQLISETNDTKILSFQNYQVLSLWINYIQCEWVLIVRKEEQCVTVFVVLKILRKLKIKRVNMYTINFTFLTIVMS